MLKGLGVKFGFMWGDKWKWEFGLPDQTIENKVSNFLFRNKESSKTDNNKKGVCSVLCYDYFFFCLAWCTCTVAICHSRIVSYWQGS